ncbi:MAG TPA: hypothetical protein VFA35_04345 [Burkholderiaceae bacterium]|nr:hypothetical protein [Burkholderiaceae bacterium]
MRLRTGLLLLLAGCASGAPPRADLERLRAAVPVARELPPGAVVRLLPVSGALPANAPAAAVDGLWREALRQSARLDIAAGPVAAGSAVAGNDPPPALQLAFDATALTLTATLTAPGTSLHLAAVPLGARWSAALDELAARTRLALGDRLDADPVPVGLAYAEDMTLVAGCERALDGAQDGEFGAAWRQLTVLRPRDGGSPFLLEALASVASLRGQPADAVEIATEALQMRQRLSPVTQHRLLRTLLLAQASLDAGNARRRDQELLTLATVARRERPYDPEPRLTLGLALNFLGRFDEARAELQALVPRLSRSTTVRYHLGWAELALGDARAASAEFTAIAPLLPQAALIVPRALARYESGDQEGLRSWLQQLIEEHAIASGDALHEVRRMQAAHALLTGRRDEAADRLLQDVGWLLEQPSRLRYRAGEFAETGEVLVRIGHGEGLRPALATLGRLQTDAALADAVSFVSAMVDTAATRRLAVAAAEGLQQRGATVWGHVLLAYGHEVLGELAAERAALAQAAQQSSSPLVKAALLQNLHRSGDVTGAAALRAALHRELAAIDLRRRSQHPLLSPECALAWLAE